MNTLTVNSKMYVIGMRLVCGIAGVLLGMIVTFLVIRPTVDTIVARFQSCQSERNALVQENQAQKAVIVANSDVATVLYEAAPSTTSPLANIATALSGGQAREAEMQPRWFVPGCKVRPIVYGDPRTVRIFYVDAAGRREGPIAPDLVAQ